MRIALNAARMSRRRRGLVRFVPFSTLRKEEQEGHDADLVGERLAPVQPAGYGMRTRRLKTPRPPADSMRGWRMRRSAHCHTPAASDAHPSPARSC